MASGEPAEIVAAALVWMTERTLYRVAVRGYRHQPKAIVAVLADIWWEAIAPPAST